MADDPQPPRDLLDRFLKWFPELPWAPTLSVVVVLAGMVLIAQMLVGQGSAHDVRDIEYARGFITVLFGVGTIGVAIVVALSGVFLTDDKAKERFDRGKEVLSLLLGIFGTIVGFYYGTKQSESTKPTATLTRPQAAVSEPKGDQAPATGDVKDKSGNVNAAPGTKTLEPSTVEGKARESNPPEHK